MQGSRNQVGTGREPRRSAATGFLLTFLFARTQLEAAIDDADASPVQSCASRLRELAALHEEGTISDTDFDTKKEELLRNL